MKTRLLTLLLIFFSFSAHASQTYTCYGPNVSGRVQVALSHQPTANDLFPRYTTHSNLTIEGHRVNLACAGDLSYFEREIPGSDGLWVYDQNIRVFALCGANLGIGYWGEGFHLEVSANRVRGYLGHRDHLQSPEDLSAYDFECR